MADETVRHTLTSTAGAPVPDNQNSITAGPRGPLLMQDYRLMEKMESGDHASRLCRTGSLLEVGCGRFARVGCALLCFVAPTCNGAPWQAVEFTSYLEPTTALIMPGSRVRVPPFPL